MRVLEDVRERPLEQARIGVDARQRLRDVELDRPVRRGDAAYRGRQDLLEADGRGADLEGAGLQPAHVEQVPDERVQPVRLLVDRPQELVLRLGCPVDVVLEQARDRGLDRGDRRPQVVRHRGEQRGAKLVRRRERSRGLGLGLELAELDRGGELLREGVEHALILAADRGAGEHEHVLVVEVDRQRSCLRALRHAIPARRLDQPTVVLAVEDGGAVEPEHAAEAVEHGRRRRRSREAEQGLGLRPGSPALDGSPGRERDEAADDDRDDEEDDDREDVLAVVDREGVERRHEVPVHEQGAADRRGERGPEPADSRHEDDEQQEEEHHGGEAELAAEVREHPGEERERERREREAERPLARAAVSPAAGCGERRTRPPSDRPDG